MGEHICSKISYGFCLCFSLHTGQGEALCKDCFYTTFETEVHHAIISNKLFEKGEVVAIGASGGKGDFGLQ